MKVRPRGDRVVVGSLKDAGVSAGGILIPESSKQALIEGVIMEVGPGRVELGKAVPVDLQQGDIIAFGQYVEAEIMIDGKECFIMREHNVMAVLEGYKMKKLIESVN